MGVSGMVTKTTELLNVDVCELPQMLVAIIVAQTLDPQTKLNGDAIKTLLGIVHCIAFIITLDEPLQCTRS